MSKKGGENTNAATGEQNQSDELERLRAYAAARAKTKNWFYLGVGVFATVIITFWGYGMYSQLSNFDWQKTQEKDLMEQNKKSWKEVFDAVGAKDTEEIKTQIKEALAQIKQAAEESDKNETATTTTSTLDTATTTESLLTNATTTTSTITTTTNQ